ncbi:MAG: tetratricopeptide repeat protein [Ginsengibacter sp.]
MSLKLKKWLLLLLLFNTTEHIHAQNVETDSLKKVLDTITESPQRVLVLEGLSFAYRSAYPDTALQYALEGLELARKINDPIGEAYCTNALGNVYFAVSDYSNALEMYLQSLKMKENLKNQKSAIAVTYFNIADVYTEQEDYRHALYYLFKTMEVDENVKDTGGILFDQYSLSSIYLRMKKTDSALYYAEKAYQLALNLHDENLIGAIVNNYGEIYLALNNLPLAEKNYRHSITLSEAVNDNEVLAANYFGLAKMFRQQGVSDSGIFYANKALSIAQSAPFLKVVVDASTFLAGIYKSTKQFDSAFHYQELSMVTKDSIFNVQKIQRVQSLKLQEQQRQQAIELAQVKYRNKINLYAVIFASCVFLFIALLLWRSNHQRRKDYKLLQQQKSKTDEALEELRNTQAQLLQKEKMASLGELTAGIAHEIKNPLNFINNFAELNAELLDELKEKMDTAPDDKIEQELIHESLKQNLEKIIRHGKRADSIVKNMLEHSRSSGGLKEPTDINALADEYMKLAYQGIRAADKSVSAGQPGFNAAMQTHFDEALSTDNGKINIVPQDIGRVLLNLFNNAFYAVNEKKKQLNGAYTPIVSVTTKKLDGKITIAVHDNGMGMPQKVLNKIFQPFYTTKPTGEGTGLGLSLSYDIITKAYGGELKVNTKEGEFTEFVIELPV